MRELLTAAEMRAIETAAMQSGAVSGLELMERAGGGVVEAVFEWRPELAAAPGRAVVFCGPGNNGGDGYVVARLLHQQGWKVEVQVYGDVEKLPPDAAANYRRWRELGEVGAFGEPPEADLYIDALFGGGLSRPLDDRLKAAQPEPRPEIAERTMAVDAPSGLCLDSGVPLGFSLVAGATCTFQRERRGHRLAEGPERCGRLIVKDIGLEAWLRPEAVAEVLERPPITLAAPDPVKLTKSGARHKYGYGHALVLSGGVGKGGAARLSARAALRIGAGLVTVGAPPAALIEHAAQLNAIMLARIDGPDALGALLEDPRFNSVVAGPGLGVSDKTRDLVLTALSGDRRTAVLDADALTAFAETPERLFAATRGRAVVLTPHMGEFGRLFPDIIARLRAPAVSGPAFSRVDAAREAAARAGCVVLLKGPDTVIADEGGGVSIASASYDRACPWLATAGAGDVLAGFIGGLLARGFSARDAAATGAWLHQDCARRFGPGLIAEDLSEVLPDALRALGA